MEEVKEEYQIVYETFTDKEIKGYAKCWGCGRKEAVRRLSKIIVV